MIEADEQSKEEQWAELCKIPLPIHSVVWSGGKSLHAIVKIDAGHDRKLYAARVKMLHDYLEQNGFSADRATKNPSRLTRIPGFRRGGDVQYFVAGEFGPKNWETFERFVLLQLDEADETLIDSKDAFALAQYVLDQIGKENLLRIDQQWWRYKTDRWVQIGTPELRAMITRLLHGPVATLDGDHIRVSSNLVANITENLNGMLFLEPDHYKMPCFLPDGESAERFICFKNGLVDIDELAVKMPEECTVRTLDNRFFGEPDVDFAFDPQADCPTWKASLLQIFPDSEIRKSFQHVFGYALSRSTQLNKFAICFGPAGTGKSSCLEVLRALVGEKNCAAIPLHELGGKYYGAELTQKWLNAVEELADDNRNLAHAENVLKSATSGGVIKVEKKYENVDKERCRAFHFFCCNTLPTFSDRSKGLWDRIILIPFEQVFRGTEKQDKDIVTEWMKELPGIFNWAMAGLREIASKECFPLPKVLVELIDRERSRCDVEGSFLRDVLEKGSAADFVSCPLLLQHYREYTDQLGVPSQSPSVLYASLQQNFPFARKSHTNVLGKDMQIMRGVVLRNSQPSIGELMISNITTNINQKGA